MLVIFIITFVVYSAIVFKTINPIHSFTIWKSVAVDGMIFTKYKRVLMQVEILTFQLRDMYL